MVPKKRYKVQWNVYGALAAVERPVGDNADNRIWCYLNYGSYDVLIRRNR